MYVFIILGSILTKCLGIRRTCDLFVILSEIITFQIIHDPISYEFQMLYDI